MNISDLFLNHTFYQIVYGKNHLPFMDKSATGYLFTEKNAAQEFSSEHKNTEVVGPESLSYESFSHKSYAQGFMKIEIRDNVIERFTTKRFLLTEYVNPFLNRTILLLHIYQEESIYKNLKTCTFIVPSIVSSKTNTFAYAVVSSQGMEDYYAAFSDLTLFDSFNSEKKENWKPLRMNFPQLLFISSGFGIVINPFSRFSLFVSKERLEKLKGVDLHET